MRQLFSGVHEVRVLRPTRVVVGYFDDFEAALRAIGLEPHYKAAYFALGPVRLPIGTMVNPGALNPAAGAASTSDIERRTLLLIDLDPPRPSTTNATDAEKQMAREEADRVREWLSSQGWPEPMLCDSGNGWHLIYRINLPNDTASTEMLKRLLARMKQLFPLVDAGNYDPARVCKLYGSWARKGEHSEERPWRLSRIENEGSSTVVTEQQIMALLRFAE
jgi:hypothetical protein